MDQVIHRMRGVMLHLENGDDALPDVAVVVEADLALQCLQFGGGDHLADGRRLISAAICSGVGGCTSSVSSSVYEGLARLTCAAGGHGGGRPRQGIFS